MDQIADVAKMVHETLLGLVCSRPVLLENGEKSD